MTPQNLSIFIEGNGDLTFTWLYKIRSN